MPGLSFACIMKSESWNLRKIYPSDPKERGEWVELLFMATAARYGLKVSKPHGDARYDVIIEGGEKLYRVQVKSTTFNRRGCYECLCFWSRVSAKGTPKRYSRRQIDLVAAYIVPEDAWFLVRVSALHTTTLYLPPPSRAQRSRYGPYLEAWHLFGVDMSAISAQFPQDSTRLVAPASSRL